MAYFHCHIISLGDWRGLSWAIFSISQLCLVRLIRSTFHQNRLSWLSAEVTCHGCRGWWFWSSLASYVPNASNPRIFSSTQDLPKSTSKQSQFTFFFARTVRQNKPSGDCPTLIDKVMHSMKLANPIDTGHTRSLLVIKQLHDTLSMIWQPMLSATAR